MHTRLNVGCCSKAIWAVDRRSALNGGLSTGSFFYSRRKVRDSSIVEPSQWFEMQRDRSISWSDRKGITGGACVGLLLSEKRVSGACAQKASLIGGRVVTRGVTRNNQRTLVRHVPPTTGSPALNTVRRWQPHGKI